MWVRTLQGVFYHESYFFEGLDLWFHLPKVPLFQVNGLVKRTVPLIIGGSDLIPHIQDVTNTVDDLHFPSANPMEPDDNDEDDWGFGNKKRGRVR